MVDSLTKILPGGNGRSQLDDLLAHVFRDILVPEFQSDIDGGHKSAPQRQRWIKRLNTDAYELFKMVGEDETRQKNVRLIRNRTLSYLRTHHTKVDLEIADVLIKYCFQGDSRKTTLLNWLRGLDIADEDIRQLELPASWTACDEESNDSELRGRREQRALKAIESIAILSTHYQPLILAFDQLESFRGKEAMTLAWGDTVREIFTRAPNMLIVTCIFPSLWREDFEPLAIRRDDWRSATDRFAQSIVELDPFAPELAVGLLASRINDSFARHSLPTTIYPFTEADVATLCQNVTSPRGFLQAAQRLFDKWLDGVPTTPQIAVPVVVTREQIDELFRNQLFELRADFGHGSADSRIPGELAFFGQIRDTFESVLAAADEPVTFGKLSAGGKVMPSNFVLQAPSGVSLCVAVCNAEGRSLFACLQNFVKAVQQSRVVAVLLRDQRYHDPTGKSAELIDTLSRNKNIIQCLTRGEFGLLNAIYQTLVAIEEHDLTIGSRAVDKREFVRYIRGTQAVSNLSFMRQAAIKFPPLDRAMNVSAPTLELKQPSP